MNIKQVSGLYRLNAGQRQIHAGLSPILGKENSWLHKNLHLDFGIGLISSSSYSSLFPSDTTGWVMSLVIALVFYQQLLLKVGQGSCLNKFRILSNVLPCNVIPRKTQGSLKQTSGAKRSNNLMILCKQLTWHPRDV